MEVTDRQVLHLQQSLLDSRERLQRSSGVRHIDTFNKPGPVCGGQHNGFEHGGDRRRGLRSRGHGMEARLERRH